MKSSNLLPYLTFFLLTLLLTAISVEGRCRPGIFLVHPRNTYQRKLFSNRVTRVPVQSAWDSIHFRVRFCDIRANTLRFHVCYQQRFRHRVVCRLLDTRPRTQNLFRIRNVRTLIHQRLPVRIRVDSYRKWSPNRLFERMEALIQVVRKSNNQPPPPPPLYPSVTPSAFPSLSPLPSASMIPQTPTSPSPSQTGGISDPQLMLWSPLSNSFNSPFSGPIVYMVKYAAFLQDIEAIDMQINNVSMPSTAMKLKTDALQVTAPLSVGVNILHLSIFTEGMIQKLHSHEHVWVGTNTLVVTLVDRNTQQYVQNTTVKVSLKDDVGVSMSKWTTSGTVTFNDIPDEMLSVEALSVSGSAGSSVTSGSAGVSIITL